MTFLCIFLPVTLLLYRLMPSIKAKNVLLLAASLVFYAYGEPVYVLLMLVSAACNYCWARLLARFEGRLSARRAVMVLAVVQNLGVLGVFKYAGMVVSSLNALTGLALPAPQITLPIGISFFTFQAMSYVIDVYRGQVQAQRSFANILLYISLFPQLIAGPIVKYHDIAAEIEERRQTPEGLAKGFRRFIVGLAKKVLVANYMAVVADAMFAANPADLNAIGAWIGILAYTLQIYFDFSGYSDMAIGLGWMFGFHFKENFRHPYASTSIREFWTRWHISLSTWFKEYLYIPLGGNRRGQARTALNKVVVFLTCGLWHGASWTFVFWGLYHGFFQLLEVYVPFFKKGRQHSRAGRAAMHVYLLLVVVVGWVFFRADSFSQALFWIGQMFAGWHFEPNCMQLALAQLSPLNLCVFAVGAVCCLPVLDKLRGKPALQKASWVLSIVLLALCILSLASGTYNPFIYFRF
ncbi:MAG: MBOAT family O-acyltransferase [Coriobacteriales bacterium]